jgi:hypothetical protein
VPNALQCPACGHKHRLSGLSGDPIFTCSECGRLLKTPAEYRRPEPSGPGEAPRPSASARVTRGGTAARDRTAVQPSPRPAASPPRRRPRRPGPATDLALPLRILAWVVAFGLGAVIVRWFARVTGWLTGDSVIDLITGSGIMRYVRIFTVVPFWALVVTGLATLFIDGGRWLARRRAIAAGRAVPPPRRSTRPKRPAPAAPRRAAPGPTSETPSRAPAAPVPATPPPGRQPAPKPAAAPTGTAGAPRPRRIPRRDVNS